jgi:hypothetical protein
MKELYWRTLVDNVRRGQCVLVLGSELPFVSADTSPAALGSSDAPPVVTMGTALGSHLARQLAQEQDEPIGGGLAGIAQQYEDTRGFGAVMLRSEAAAFARDCQLSDAGIHRSLGLLPFKLVLTTAHDACFEKTLADACGKTPVVYRYHLRGDGRDNPDIPEPTSTREPIVYHLFGDVTHPDSLVLSENDLLDFLIAVIRGVPPLPNRLTGALKRIGQSFLFVGFGIRDWYLRVLLKVLVRAFDLNDSGRNSFALELQQLPAGDREQTLLYYQRGTRIELIDLDMAAFVAELTRRVNAAGGEIADSRAPGRLPRVFICYSHDDAPLAARLASSLSARHIDPWLDQHDLEGGHGWQSRIETALDDMDFFLVLHSASLARKEVSFINVEISLALKRGRWFATTPFIIPLALDDLSDENRIASLKNIQDMPLRQPSYEQDVSAIASKIQREFQRRSR